ncbi:MAG TPA: ATP-binding protein [Chitinophagaceae bacterium]|nr:ATP-binding protein [Chitinophagaceae bacterium]
MNRKVPGMLTGLAGRKKVKIIQQVPATLSIYADPDHFDFIIRNLLSNAIKFSHTGGTVTIAAEAKKDEVLFSVRDEGVGIPVEKQKQFDTGNLSVAYGTNGEKGTGLGLLLTKEFIKVNKGRIWFQSTQGQRTTFYFSFPL